MTVYKLYYGGDRRHVGFEHSRSQGYETALIRYAGHLPTKHLVLPFEYDGTSDEWRQFHSMHEPFVTGDVVHTHALSADSRIETLVFHNKKAVGTRDPVSNAITTAAKVKLGLYAGETMVAESDEIDLSVIGRTVVEFGTGAIKKASTKKDTNNDGTVNAGDTPEATVVTDRGAYLNQNGTIRLTVVEGAGIASACFTAFVELTDFLDVRGCGCEKIECESSYPDPIC